jgi:hypothetical protein
MFKIHVTTGSCSIFSSHTIFTIALFSSSHTLMRPMIQDENAIELNKSFFLFGDFATSSDWVRDVKMQTLEASCKKKTNIELGVKLKC